MFLYVQGRQELPGPMGVFAGGLAGMFYKILLSVTRPHDQQSHAYVTRALCGVIRTRLA